MASLTTPPSQKRWAPGEIRAYVRLLVEYLRLSPSYALASEMTNQGYSAAQMSKLIVNLYEKASSAPLTTQSKQQLVKEFQSVLKTREEFGDVVGTPFDTWWNTRGIDLFGLDRAPPKVQALAHLHKGNHDISQALDRLKKYADVRKAEGSPSSLIVAIPLGITKRMQLGLISKLLEAHKEEMPIKSAKSKRPFAVQRLRREPLEKGIHLLWLHARLPELTLWRLGVAAKVSKTYSEGLHAINSRVLDSNLDSRHSLAILTRRMLTRAQLTAENAAHGIFPSHEKRLLPEFDNEQVFRRMIKSNPKLIKNKPDSSAKD